MMNTNINRIPDRAFFDLLYMFIILNEYVSPRYCVDCESKVNKVWTLSFESLLNTYTLLDVWSKI